MGVGASLEMPMSTSSNLEEALLCVSTSERDQQIVYFQDITMCEFTNEFLVLHFKNNETTRFHTVTKPTNKKHYYNVGVV